MYSHNQIIMEWYQGTPGQNLFQVEKDLLTRTLSGSTGRCFLHWSNHDRYQLESKVYFEEHIYLSIQNDFPLFIRGVQADPYALPFLSESVDVVLFPHLLEFIPDPFSLLRETSRILRPGGSILILNFNPVSFWGLGRLMHKGDRFPWHGKSISALYLRCFLARLGLSVVQYKTDFFRPLLYNHQTLERYLPLETIGQLCWPFLGATYMMVVRKEKEELIKIKSTPYTIPSVGMRGREPEPAAHIHTSKS